MRKFEFIRPQTNPVEESATYGKYVITPLERGYGITNESRTNGRELTKAKCLRSWYPSW